MRCLETERHAVNGFTDAAEASDEGLLRRFIDGGGGAEGAFEALVRRHGPMVLNVCRQVLADAHEVEDAFQATFLLLVRKAALIRDPHLLGNWLYGVAYRVAARARSRSYRRSQHERQGLDMASAGAAETGGYDDLGPVLHEEVNRLPEKYRAPVLLCYLQGMTNEQAAAELQWPVGTVKGRLMRVRELLRERLGRRRLALPAALLMLLVPREGWAAVPDPLVKATVRAAMRESALLGLPRRPGHPAASATRRPPRTLRQTLAIIYLVGFGLVATTAGTRRGMAWYLEWRRHCDEPIMRQAAPRDPAKKRALKPETATSGIPPRPTALSTPPMTDRRRDTPGRR